MKHNIIIFGASKAGQEAFKKLCEYYNVIAFVDNDKNKWGNTLYHRKILQPDDIKNMRDIDIYIASDYRNEIIKQLEEMEIYNWYLPPFFSEVLGMKYEKIVNKASKNLYYKLIKMNINKVNISDYNKRYLNDILTNIHIMLKVYSEMLIYVLSSIDKDIATLNFLDYGGGTGILSLLALECGIKNVYYNDIYDTSCDDAFNIAEELEYKRKAYIKGDLEEVIEFCNAKRVFFDCVTSYDVLEHIYDLDTYFDKVSSICNNQSIILKTTSANSYNKLVVEKLARLHEDAENNRRELVYGWKERDSLAAFKNIRKDIIKDHLMQNKIMIDQYILDKLVFNTKGRIKKDIINIVDDFVESGIMYSSNEYFKTNTCDPLTGNWAEHLINYDNLKKQLLDKGYEVDILPKLQIEQSSRISLSIKISKEKE